MHVTLHRGTLDKFKPREGERLVTLGVVSPGQASKKKVQRMLRMVPGGGFVTGHVPYTDDFADIMCALRMKMVLIVCDPRDVAVSNSEYVASQPNHPLFRLFASLPDDQRLMAAITGREEQHGTGVLRSVGECMESVLAWDYEPSVYVTTFEKLVGPAGGGTSMVQIQEIKVIADHVGGVCSDGQRRRFPEACSAYQYLPQGSDPGLEGTVHAGACRCRETTARGPAHSPRI